LLICHRYSNQSTQIIAGIIGYFGIDQKSRKINKGYQCMGSLHHLDLLILSCIFSTASAIGLITHIGKLDGTPFQNTSHEFLMLLILFPIIQILICYFCLNQFRKASHENFSTPQLFTKRRRPADQRAPNR
jgi:hypothetical protein